MNKLCRQAKLVAGMLASGEEFFEKAGAVLEKTYGAADYISRPIPFVFTRYYEKEFGPGLYRKFVSFKKHIDQGCLARIKLHATEIERSLSAPGGRRINIDPGYVTGAKLVLATTKDYGHRIYLARGIYAEVTLRFRNGSFRPLEWTYPDYRSDEYIGIFNAIRVMFMEDMKTT